MKNNYSQEDFLENEKSLNNKIMDFTEVPKIKSQLSEAYYIWLNNPNVITDYIDENDLDDETFTKFFDWFIHDFKLIDTQCTVIESFYDESEDISDIEELIIKDWMESYCSFFEITSIEKNSGCSIKDLLNEKEFVINDKNASNHLKVSDLIYARPIKTGEEHYFSGVISVFPQILRKNILNLFDSEFSEYKKQFGPNRKPQDFLKDWSYIICKELEELLNHPQYLNPDGDEFVIAKSYYKISKRKTFLEKVRKEKDFIEISDIKSDINLFLSARDKNSSYLEVDGNKLTIETNSFKNLEILKENVESVFKDYLTHTKDLIKDLNSYTKKESESTKILSKKNKNSLDEFYDKWINIPLDALGGKTPLEAIEDNEYKDELERILKELEQLYDDAKKHGEPFYEVNEIRKKLLSSLNH